MVLLPLDFYPDHFCCHIYRDYGYFVYFCVSHLLYHHLHLYLYLDFDPCFFSYNAKHIFLNVRTKDKDINYMKYC